MADLSINTALVAGSANGSPTKNINFGATIAQGDVVYLDTTTNTWKLADSNGASTGTAANARIGIALVGGANGQPGVVTERDSYLTVGGTLTNGIVYCMSPNAGKIAPVTDITTGNVAQVLGVAKSTTVLNFNPTPSGATV